MMMMMKYLTISLQPEWWRNLTLHLPHSTGGVQYLPIPRILIKINHFILSICRISIVTKVTSNRIYCKISVCKTDIISKNVLLIITEVAWTITLTSVVTWHAIISLIIIIFRNLELINVLLLFCRGTYVRIGAWNYTILKLLSLVFRWKFSMIQISKIFQIKCKCLLFIINFYFRIQLIFISYFYFF